MKLFLHKFAVSKNKWRLEGYLECSENELRFIGEHNIGENTIASVSAKPGGVLKAIWSYVSFGSNGSYRVSAKERIVSHSYSGEIQYNIFEKLFLATSRRTIKLQQLMLGFSLDCSLEKVNDCSEQINNFVENLQTRVEMYSRLEKNR